MMYLYIKLGTVTTTNQKSGFCESTVCHHCNVNTVYQVWKNWNACKYIEENFNASVEKKLNAQNYFVLTRT